MWQRSWRLHENGFAAPGSWWHTLGGLLLTKKYVWTSGLGLGQGSQGVRSHEPERTRRWMLWVTRLRREGGWPCGLLSCPIFTLFRGLFVDGVATNHEERMSSCTLFSDVFVIAERDQIWGYPDDSPTMIIGTILHDWRGDGYGCPNLIWHRRYRGRRWVSILREIEFNNWEYMTG